MMMTQLTPGYIAHEFIMISKLAYLFFRAHDVNGLRQCVDEMPKSTNVDNIFMTFMIVLNC